MSTFRLATFNVENLFARYKFNKNFDPISEDGFTINNLAYDIYNDVEKQITAKALAETKADIIALQEVENLLLLDKFHSQMLQGRMFKYRIVIDGNDPRNIDVAVMSKYPIISIKSYRHERNKENNADLFSRDCLEVDIDINGKIFTIFANHFKSMMGGREKTRDRRVEQAERVVEIIENRFGSELKGNFAVVGDLNDYPEDGEDTTTALTALLKHKNLINIVEKMPKNERWTHWYKGAKKGMRAKQIDYIFLPKLLYNEAGKPVPKIERRGLPWRAEEDYSGVRFDGIGQHDPKASDHCPLYVDIPLSALS